MNTPLSNLSQMTLHKWRSLQLEFHRCGRSIWPPNHYLTRTWFKNTLIDFTIWFFFQGKGTIIDDKGKEYPLYPGIFLCMVPGMSYEAYTDNHDRLGDSYLHITFKDKKRLLPQKEWPKIPWYQEIIDVHQYDQVLRNILSLVGPTEFLSRGRRNQEDALSAEFYTKGILLDLLKNQRESNEMKANGIDRHHEKKISQTLASVYENPLAFHSVEDMARISGYSAGYFRVLCHKITGQKPSDILIKIRVERAKNYLLSSDMNIGTIAESLGYENIYYFSRQFKEVTGYTPTQYRTQRIKSTDSLIDQIK